MFENGPFPGHRNFESRAKELPHLHGELISKNKIFHVARYLDEEGKIQTKVIDGAGRLEAIRLGKAHINEETGIVVICHDCKDYSDATSAYNSCN